VRLPLRGLSLAQQLGKGFELPAEIVEPLDGLQLLLEAAGLTENVLGFLGAGPEVGRRRLLSQLLERAPRSVLIKGSPEAPRGAPRRPTEKTGDRRVRSSGGARGTTREAREAEE
jgi:hypothetical protein